MATARGLTLMTIHAHPDDETIGTGGTMAKAVRDGHRVVLVTGTRGELGEIVVPELDTPDNHRRLGEIRAAVFGLVPSPQRESPPDSGARKVEARDRGPFDCEPPAELGHVSLYMRQIREPELRRTVDQGVVHSKGVVDRTVVAKMTTNC